MDINERIKLEIESSGKEKDEIKELILDNCKATSLEGITVGFTNLVVLSLNAVGLVSLDKFPALASLKKLELSDNKISGGLERLTLSTKLKRLNLSGNRIKDVATVDPLKALSDLRSLDLFSCDVTEVEDYRALLFQMIPSLMCLDGNDIDDNELSESDLTDEDGDEDGEEGDGAPDEEEYDEEEENGDGDEDDGDDGYVVEVEEEGGDIHEEQALTPYDEGDNEVDDVDENDEVEDVSGDENDEVEDASGDDNDEVEGADGAEDVDAEEGDPDAELDGGAEEEDDDEIEYGDDGEDDEGDTSKRTVEEDEEDEADDGLSVKKPRLHGESSGDDEDPDQE